MWGRDHLGVKRNKHASIFVPGARQGAILTHNKGEMRVVDIAAAAAAATTLQSRVIVVNVCLLCVVLGAEQFVCVPPSAAAT